ncbi:MAG: transcription termination/antitermination protein NusA [candidate division WS1 bacterium]|nr:transcription termination/antitermination protein NusA [candidate division WS1 bacterium]
MNGEFIDALEQLQREKDIPMTALIDTVEAAMASAYRKHYGASDDVRLEVDFEKRVVRLFARTLVEGEEVVDDDGLTMNVRYEEHEVDAAEFGRIAAQTAKQVVMQRVREAEREIVFDEFSHRVGEMITGEVQRKDNRNAFIAVGRTEALLPANEQIPGETFRFGDRLKLYVLDVRKTTRNPQIVLSRRHPGLVVRLFEQEVPEVFDGIVEIKSVAREAGARSKVAVVSRDPQIDAVGACVGHRGARVQSIVDELRGEKIDIVRFSEDSQEYLKSSLSPARVSQVILSDDERSAVVVAPDDQLSLAIGRRGQNVRLAAQLTGWRIDIQSQSQWESQAQKAVEKETAAAVEEARRVRVYELAQELGVPSPELVEIMQEEGMDVTSHASSVTAAEADIIRDLLLGGEGTLDDIELGNIEIEL